MKKIQIILACSVLVSSNLFSSSQFITDSVNAFTETISKYFSTSSDSIQGSGKLISQEKVIENITNIHIKGIGTLNISQGDRESLVITTDDNIMPYIHVVKNNNTLSLSIDAEHPINTTKLEYKLIVKNLAAVRALGSTITQLHTISANTLQLDVKGSSTLSGSITVETLELDAAGSTKVTLTGKAKEQKIDIKGSSRFNGNTLTGANAYISSKGASNIELNISDKISGSMAGAGTLSYSGNPTVTVSQSGAVKIHTK